jgi:hypothetical protein
VITTDDVRIAQPCGLDFRKMTRAEANRRFCGACKKHVHDMTLMSEEEAKALLSSPSTEELCVRYAADARGRLVFQPDVPVSRLQRARRALTLTAASVAAALAGGCASTIEDNVMMGAIESVPNRPETATSFELVREGARVSVTDVRGVFLDQKGNVQVHEGVAEGKCEGDEQGCAVAVELIQKAQSTAEFVAGLQAAGFALVQQVKGPCPPRLERPAAT